MEGIIVQIHKFLLKNKKTIAVAESCTGGLVSTLLTQIPGSSKFFILGVIAYNNKVKSNLLNVPPLLFAKKGAVSDEVAQKMSQGVRKLAKTDFAISITGIAGPTGGTPAKPVGTVFIAASNKNKTISRKFNFKGNRSTIRKKAALQSLRLLKSILKA
jgi:nicotinamide-nucleotide amidase